MAQHYLVDDQVEEDPENGKNRDMSSEHGDGDGVIPGFWFLKQNIEASVKQPRGLETHGEAEAELGKGVLVCGGRHGLEPGKEGAGGREAIHDCVAKRSALQSNLEVPEE